MIPTFSHNLNNSFFLWFDNLLATKAQAHKTYKTKLYNYDDARLGGSKVTYGSPYKQWVYDNNISGATIPSGLTIDGTFTATGTSGMTFDFDNGRVIFNSGVSTGLDITGTYTVKEFNTYITDKTEESLIVENKFIENSRFTVTETYIPPYDAVTPAIFISSSSIQNEPFALGGQDMTNVIMRGVVFGESLYQVDGVLSTCADAAEECFGLIPMEKHPLAEFRNIKTGLYPTGYDYKNAAKDHSTGTVFVNEVDTAKMRDSISKELNPTLHIGFIDFEIGMARYPRL
jgi:hypothetical protein